MLEILVLILLIVWLTCTVCSYTLGGWMHCLLIVAVIVAVVRLFRGNKWF